MIAYQIAMTFCVISESVGTAALSDYVDQQDGLWRRHKVSVHNDSFIGIASYNVFVGIAVATIFGSGFFFDLFWPERRETPAVRIAWKISSLVVSLMALADAIALTVIVATRRSWISGVTPAQSRALFKENGPPNAVFRHNAECVTSAVLIWPGMIGSFASTYIMWKSIAHDDKLGPFSSKYKPKSEEVSIDMKPSNTIAAGAPDGTAPAIKPYEST